MSQINSIIFDNFRVFDVEYKMDVKPLTFLTGPNSSGKSSVLKSILLLKSNYSSNMQVLDFTGEKHNLGTFKDTINNLSDKELICLGVTAKLSNGTPFGFGFYKEPVTTKRSVFYVLKEDSGGKETDLTLKLYYRKVERSGKVAKLEIFSDENRKPFLTLEIGKNEKENHTLEIDHNTIIGNEYLNDLFLNFRLSKDRVKKKSKTAIVHRVALKRYTTTSKFTMQEGGKEAYYDEPILVFSHLYKKYLVEMFKASFDKEIHNFFLRQPLKQILQDFSSIIENSEYIEAVRANTKRLYTNDSQGTGFNELILDYNSREVNDKSKKFISKWLRKFDIADEIEFENVEGVATSIYLKTGSSKIALADLGYGITQFLPILLKIALEQPIERRSKKHDQIVKKLVLIEEPETNLHPKLQSQLADFLIDAIKSFEIRLVIETHSEYLIRRLQVLVADKEFRKEDSIIYYFNNDYPDTSKEKVIRIDFEENGTLSSSFGTGFFDEATNLKFELLKRKAQP